MKANTSRGGARQRRTAQANSSTGLLGITFRWVYRKGAAVQARICVVVGKRRTGRGVVKLGAREAMRQVIKLRRDAGLQAPGLKQALAAFEDWRRSS